MSDKLLENLSRAFTWSIAADFNHIADPFGDPTETQKNHESPSFWDRLGGSVLLILMTPLIVPVCFYLFWASKKVEQIDALDDQTAAGRIATFAKTHETFQHISARNETKEEPKEKHIAKNEIAIAAPLSKKEAAKENPTHEESVQRDNASNANQSQKLLSGALLAFGPHRNKATAQKACKALEEESVLSPEIRSFLLEEAIVTNQIDKVEFLLVSSEKEEESNDKALSFNLSGPIPFHKVKSAAMIHKLMALGVKTNSYVDEKRNTPFHLVSSGVAAEALIKAQAKAEVKEQGAEFVFEKNQEGNTPLHTCQSLEVFEVFCKAGIISSEDTRAKNNYGETPTLALLTQLEGLVNQRDHAETIEEWEALSKQIQSLEDVVMKFLAWNDRQADISPNNREGYNALHLAAKMGNLALLNEVHLSNNQGKRLSIFNRESPVMTMLTELGILAHERNRARKHFYEHKALCKQVESLEDEVMELLHWNNRRANLLSRSRDERLYNTLHICHIIMGNHIHLINQNEVHWYNNQGVKQIWFGRIEDIPISGQGLYANSVANIKESSYTCCDLALNKLHFLRERLKKEENSVLKIKLTNEIQRFENVVVNTSDFLTGPEFVNHYPLHSLVERGELDLLKQMQPMSRFFGFYIINQQNQKGETPILLALKKMHALNEMKSSPAMQDGEKKVIEEELNVQKEIVEFFLNIKCPEIPCTHKGKPWPFAKDPWPMTNVNVHDYAGNSPLHLCVSMNDSTLVQKIIGNLAFKSSSLGTQKGFEEGSKFLIPLSLSLKYRKGDVETLKEFEKMKTAETEVEKLQKEEEEEKFEDVLEGATELEPAETEPKELFDLQKMLKSQIENQEKIALMLFIKAVEANDPTLMENILVNIHQEFGLEVLSFFDEKNPPLKIAFDHLIKLVEFLEKVEKIVEECLEKEEKKDKEYTAKGEYRSPGSKYLDSSSRLCDILTRLRTQAEVIEVLVNHGLTKGNEQYHPVFDVLDLVHKRVERNSDVLEQFLKSEHVNINVTKPNSGETPLHIALEELKNLKNKRRELLNILLNLPGSLSNLSDSFSYFLTYIDAQTPHEVARTILEERLNKVEKEIKVQEAIVEIILKKNPALNESLLHVCAEVGDSYLLKLIVHTKGVNVDCTRDEEGKAVSPLLVAERVLNAYEVYEEKEPKRELIHTEIENLKEVIRILREKGA